MRFAMSVEHNGQGQHIAIVGRKNNWRPVSNQTEVPDCLDYVAYHDIKKVGDRMQIAPAHPCFPLLLRYIHGEDPEATEIEKVAGDIASRLMTEFGLRKVIHRVCLKMKKRGLSNPSAPSLITKRVFSIVREQFLQ